MVGNEARQALGIAAVANQRIDDRAISMWIHQEHRASHHLEHDRIGPVQLRQLGEQGPAEVKSGDTWEAYGFIDGEI